MIVKERRRRHRISFPLPPPHIPTASQLVVQAEEDTKKGRYILTPHVKKRNKNSKKSTGNQDNLPTGFAVVSYSII
jgi:hypothetical protein